MKRKLIWVIGLFGISTAVVFVIFALSAYALDTSPTKKAPTKVLTIHASAFQSQDNYADYTCVNYLALNSSGHYHFCAPLILPNGTKIEKLEMVYYDSSPDYDLTLYIWSQNYRNNRVERAKLTTSGSTSNWRVLKQTTDITINNKKYCYYADVFFRTNISFATLRFMQLRIYYEGEW